VQFIEDVQTQSINAEEVCKLKELDINLVGVEAPVICYDDAARYVINYFLIVSGQRLDLLGRGHVFHM